MKSPASRPSVETLKPPEKPIAVATGSGTNVHSEKMWTIKWEQAEFRKSDADKVGKMIGVSGEVYELNIVSSIFQADEAEADNTQNCLVLSGHVRIVSKAKNVPTDQNDKNSPKADTDSKLSANKITWLANRKLYKAEGAVTIENKDGVIGPTDTLFVTAKLDKIGTSEQFFKP